MFQEKEIRKKEKRKRILVLGECILWEEPNTKISKDHLLHCGKLQETSVSYIGKQENEWAKVKSSNKTHIH